MGDILRGTTVLGGLVLSIVFSSQAAANKAVPPERLDEALAEAKSRCQQVELPLEKQVANGDFSWGISLDELKQTFEDIYESGKRLKSAAYYDNSADMFYLPKEFPGGDKTVPLTDEFIKSVIRHVEVALARDYADAVIFPDMGHSHVFVPQEYFNAELSDIPTEKQHILYEKMLAYPGTKFLYHTAEQLQMTDEDDRLVDNSYVQWRYYTRNPVGDNLALGRVEVLKNLTDGYNTVRQLEGHKYWGAGYYISASADGCFPYWKDGEKYYFDINLEGLASRSRGMF